MSKESSWAIVFSDILNQHVKSYSKTFFDDIFCLSGERNEVKPESLQYVSEFVALFSILGGYVPCFHIGSQCLVKGGSTGTLVHISSNSSTIEVAFGTSVSVIPQVIPFSSVVARIH